NDEDEEKRGKRKKKKDAEKSVKKSQLPTPVVEVRDVVPSPKSGKDTPKKSRKEDVKSTYVFEITSLNEYCHDFMKLVVVVSCPLG
ncbi:unnamed protein product, partial [Allacma fusca]